MAFSDFIARVFGKKTLYFYRFEVGSETFHIVGRAINFTTGNNQPNADFPTGQEFTSTSIKHGEIIQSNLANRSDTWFRLPTRNPVVQAILDYDEPSKIRITVWKTYLGDPDEEFIQRFSGRLVSHQADLILTTLNAEFAITEMQRSSVAEVVQRPCRHAHYFTNSDGGGCRLTLSDWQQPAPVTVSSGRTVTVPLAALQPDGFYLMGILEYDGVEYLIESHSGSELVLEKAVPNLADDIADANMIPEDLDVLIAPGCNLTKPNCDFFENGINFGGFEAMLDSPYDGRSVA